MNGIFANVWPMPYPNTPTHLPFYPKLITYNSSNQMDNGN